jgi:phage shock protein C
MEKRLYRSSRDRVLWGVCGGLGRYFNIDPVIVRVIFVLTIFFGGLGIIAYIVMAIVVPNENSKATEPKDTIKENVHEIKDTTESIGKDIHKTFSSKDDTDKKDQ